MTKVAQLLNERLTRAAGRETARVPARVNAEASMARSFLKD